MPELTLDDANRLIAAAFARAAELGCRPLTVAVLDGTGTILSLQRQAASGHARPAIAIGKARASLALGVSSRKISDMAASWPHFVQGVMASFPGPFMPVPGGVLITDGGQTVGAIGISGDSSDNDEAVAVAGITAIGREAVT